MITIFSSISALAFGGKLLLLNIDKEIPFDPSERGNYR
jgi:hypothetical protein